MPSKNNRRVTIPDAVEAEILVKSRRRCCLCWVLDGKDTIAQGQIAHLDHNPANNDLDNLVWLCLPHHDSYDGRTSQSKGLTSTEVKRHCDQLYQELRDGTPNNNVDVQPGAPFIRAGGNISAGGDIVVGNVTQHITKRTRGRKESTPIIPGTVAENPHYHNYLQYLAARYNELKNWECKQKGEKLPGWAIHQGYFREMKCKICHTPVTQFHRAAAYLQRRIKNLLVGRIKSVRGNKLFESFEEYRDSHG